MQRRNLLLSVNRYPRAEDRANVKSFSHCDRKDFSGGSLRLLKRYAAWLLVPWCYLSFSAHAFQVTNEQAPSNDSRCQARTTLAAADSELKLGRKSQARSLADMLGRCTGITPRERFDLGVIYGRLHDFPTALALFRSVDKSMPSLQSHAYAIALGQFELADYQGAIATLEDLSLRPSLDASSINLLAVCYSKVERYQDAYVLLMNELQKAPNDPLGYLNLITLLSDVGQPEQAVRVETRGIQVFPDSSEMLTLRGVSYTALGELEKAREDFASAVQRSPGKSRPRFFLAVTDYKMANYTQAANELRSAIADGVVDADLEYLLAECILKIDPGKSLDAMKELNRAIEISDKAVPALTLRGKLLMEDGKAREAAVDLEEAHRIDPGMRSATYNLARAYMALGRKSDAALLFQQVHEQSIETIKELSEQRMRQSLAEHSGSE